MNSTDLCYTPATELRRLIDARQVSPVEIADAVLARIERLNPTLNAFLTVTYDLARDDARAAEARQKRAGGGPELKEVATRDHRGRGIRPGCMRGAMTP